MPRHTPRRRGYEESLAGVGWKTLARFPGTKIVLYRLEPNHEVEMHSHPEAEYGVMLAGTATHTMLLTTEEGGRRRVKSASLDIIRGDCIMVPSGVPHAYVSGPKGSSVILSVIFSDDERPPPRWSDPGVAVASAPGSRSRRITGTVRRPFKVGRRRPATAA